MTGGPYEIEVMSVVGGRADVITSPAGPAGIAMVGGPEDPGAVRFDRLMTLSVAQQVQGRDNIDAVARGELPAVDVRNHGYIGDGVASDSAAINAAIQAAQPGQAVIIPAGTTARITTTIRNQNADGIQKPVNIVAAGAKIVKAADPTDHDTVQFRSGFETIYNVLSLTTTTITVADGSTGGLTATLPNSPGWVAGDVVKLIADDPIVGALGWTDPDANGTLPRVGQFLTVHAVSGPTVTLGGVLFDPYTTNIRIARMVPAVATWQGGRFDTEDSTGSTFYCESAFRPQISGVDIAQARTSGVSLVSSFAPVVRDAQVGWTPNILGTANGYGISGMASQHVTVQGCRFRMVRHGFDCGGQYAPVVNDDRIYMYGRAFMYQVSDCIVDSPTNGAFVTHSGSTFVTFSDCMARNAIQGFSLRGIYHTIKDCHVNEAQWAVYGYDDNIDAYSYGHTVDGLVCDRVQVAIRFDNGQTQGHLNYGVRIPDTHHIRNVVSRRMRNSAVVLMLNGANYEVDNIYAELTGSLNTGQQNTFRNVSLRGSNWRYWYSVSANSAPFLNIDPATDSSVEIDGIRIFGNVGARLTQLVSNTPTQTIRIRNVMLDNMPGNGVISDPFTTGFIEWGVVAIGSPGNNFVALDDTATFTVRTRQDVLTAAYTLTAARTAPALPNPQRLGQMLIIHNLPASAGNLTIPHGSSFRTNLSGGTNKVMAPGQTMMLVSITNNLWQQISAVSVA